MSQFRAIPPSTDGSTDGCLEVRPTKERSSFVAIRAITQTLTNFFDQKGEKLSSLIDEALGRHYNLHNLRQANEQALYIAKDLHDAYTNPNYAKPNLDKLNENTHQAVADHYANAAAKYCQREYRKAADKCEKIEKKLHIATNLLALTAVTGHVLNFFGAKLIDFVGTKTAKSLLHDYNQDLRKIIFTMQIKWMRLVKKKSMRKLNAVLTMNLCACSKLFHYRQMRH